jgi:hypothetical protein
MTVSKLMDEEELEQWILRRLGGLLVNVELCEVHVQDAIETSIRWFCAKKGVKKVRQLPIYSGVQGYSLPDEVDTVLDVRFQAPPMDLSLIFSPYILMDEKVPYDVFAAPQTAGLYSSYTQSLQYIEQAKRLINAEEDWRQEDRTLYVFPIPRQSGIIEIQYKSNDFKVEQLNQRDHDLLKRYALAWAKHDLGRVRSKFQSGLPGAQGNVMWDGNLLLQEAQRDMETLDKEIAQSAFPMLFLTG